MEKRSKNRQKKASTTRPYTVVMYLSVMLFVSMIGYMVWFQVTKREDILNNPHNKRQEAAAENVIRGSILSAEGNELAVTQVDDAGNQTRVYPYGSLFAHTVGYQILGGSGLEAAQSSVLLTSHADIITQVQQDLNAEKKEGDSLKTTLKLSLQQTASAVLGSNQGAVFVMDADTGDVLADVSNPSFDPNTLAENWDSLTQDGSGVFLNRATQGRYPPGSTFKMVTALAYLREHGTFDDFAYECGGTIESQGFTIHCAGYQAHGYESFADAMANSCNSAFAWMSLNAVSRQTLRETAEALGFNRDFDLAVHSDKSTFSLDGSTPDPLTMQTAIGQGDTLATPMQMCMIGQAIANGGRMMQPNFLGSIVSADGLTVRTYEPKEAGQVMTETEADQLKSIMREVVSRGTASELAGLPYDIAGKTGTAEFGDPSEGKAHSWFVGFSNTGRDDIVVCVLSEGGGDGQAPATPMAGAVFQAYFG